MQTTLYFDMDGTIADLYGVEGWLDDLNKHNVRPYVEAKGLGNLSALARRLNRLQAKGFKLGIITWCSKTGTADFHAEVARVKREWLAHHLPSVRFDEIHILPFGEPKFSVAKKNDFLFDDNCDNCKAWDLAGGFAYSEKMMSTILRWLEKGE